jgi:preprotein translocase subunit YajC
MELNSILLFVQTDGGNAETTVAPAESQQGVLSQFTEQQAPGELPEGGQQERPQGNIFMTLLPLILIFAVFYFFMIRPQKKQQKELQKKREAMKEGDRVVTAGGIFGKIKEVKDNAFIITIDKDVTIKVSKESVYADLTDAQNTNEKK